jgi:hypothetical protein
MSGITVYIRRFRRRESPLRFSFAKKIRMKLVRCFYPQENVTKPRAVHERSQSFSLIRYR